MAIDQNIIEDNPWWGRSSAIDSDPHLRRLEQQPFYHEHDLSSFMLDKDAVYTLRGPRQVGKTTLVKTMIKHLLEDKMRNLVPRQILYLNVYTAGIIKPHDLQRVMQEFIKDHRSVGNDRRLYIFLDEVTGITDWGVAVQALHERGLMENVFIFATGSSAMDIKKGGERMPGRRGDIENPDWILMPLSFRDYVRAIKNRTGEKIPKEVPTIDIFNPRRAYKQALELEYTQVSFGNIFERYLQTGGYPYVIASQLDEGYIPGRVYLQFQQAIREEMRKANRRETFFRELVSWAVEKYLGREFSWSTVSGDTEIGSKNTARQYLEDGEAVFIWHILYRMKKIGRPAPALRSPKKLYAVDPFGHHALSSWVEGMQNPWEQTLTALADDNFRGMLVESVVGDHLIRKFGPFVLYYRTAQGKEEIDFIAGQGREKYAPLEVKYRRKLKKADRKYLKKYGGGIIVSRDQLNYWEDANVAAIPAATLLAGLPYSLTLYPAEE